MLKIGIQRQQTRIKNYSNPRISQLTKMSAKSKAPEPKKESYSEMIVKAILAIKDRKGCSRSAIARWIQINCGKEGGSLFNSYLRNALKKGLESGLFKEGKTKQRFKIGELPKPAKAVKKKTNSKKKSSSKKKAGSKKKTASKKKKTSKKKTASKKKKAGSKKKVATKKKT